MRIRMTTATITITRTIRTIRTIRTSISTTQLLSSSSHDMLPSGAVWWVVVDVRFRHFGCILYEYCHRSEKKKFLLDHTGPIRSSSATAAAAAALFPEDSTEQPLVCPVSQ